jgi:hypothetical protein
MRSGAEAKCHVLQFALLRGLSASVLMVWMTGTLVAGELYRLTDEHGKVIYTDQLPPTQSKKGYGVLDAQGREKGIVPREPTAEERAEAVRQKEAQDKVERELEEQTRRDNLLLQLYGSEEAIESALEASLQISESKRKLLEMNMSGTQKNIELLKEKEALGKSHTKELVLAKKQLIKDEITLQAVDIERDAVIEHYSRILQSWKLAKTRRDLLYPKAQPSGVSPASDAFLLLSPRSAPRPQTGGNGKN